MIGIYTELTSCFRSQLSVLAILKMKQKFTGENNWRLYSVDMKAKFKRKIYFLKG